MNAVRPDAACAYPVAAARAASSVLAVYLDERGAAGRGLRRCYSGAVSVGVAGIDACGVSG